MELIEYLQLWFDGKEIEPAVNILGLELFWWERIGKILQLVAGCFVIIDIIGDEAIKGFSARLSIFSKKVTELEIQQYLRNQALLVRLWFKRNQVAPDSLDFMSRYETALDKKMEEYEEVQREMERIKNSSIGYKATLIAGVIFYIGFNIIVFIDTPQLKDLISTLMASIFLIPIFYLLLLVSAFVFWQMPIYLLQNFLLNPITRVLRERKYEKVALVFSFLFFLIGGIIDFLAG